MADVMIGIDPHKGSHTAVAVDASEAVVGELRAVPQRGRSISCAPGHGVGPSAAGQ